MAASDYGFFLVFHDASGALAYEEEIKDLPSLWQDVVFSAVCRGKLPNDGQWRDTTVEPIIADGRLSGVTVSVAGLRKSYGLSIFADRAWEVLLSRSVLQNEKGDEERRLSWEIKIRARKQEPQRRRFTTSVIHTPFPLTHGSLSDFGIPDCEQQKPFSVWISSSLFDELREESATCLDHERADFLTGHIVQVPNGNVAVVLLDRIAANVDTKSSAVHISFSPLTFQAVRQELERRSTNQVITGWSHNHPPPCGRECLMTIPACKTENVFMSVADRTVHRSGFAAPYMVAFITGKGAHRRADDSLIRAYRWRGGRIRETRFSIF